jgi:hypothetical protein
MGWLGILCYQLSVPRHKNGIFACIGLHITTGQWIVKASQHYCLVSMMATLGAAGTFLTFFCFWSAAHFLQALPSGPILVTFDNQYLPGSSWGHANTIILVCLAKWPYPCNHCQLVSFWQWLLPLSTLPSLIIVGTTGEFSDVKARLGPHTPA